MKKITFLLLFIFANVLLFSQLPYKIQVGDQLVYQVEAGNNEYKFTVTPTKLSASGITFEYRISEPVNTNGEVSMNSEALKSSMAMYNYFSGGKVNLTKETSVFISKAMVDSAMKGSSDLFTNGADGTSENFVTLDGTMSPTSGSGYIRWIKNINGTDYALDGPILENSDGSHAIRYTDGGGFPFITYMETDFKVYILEIIRKK